MSVPHPNESIIPSRSFLEELNFWVVRFDWRGEEDDAARFVRWLHEKAGQAGPTDPDGSGHTEPKRPAGPTGV